MLQSLGVAESCWLDTMPAVAFAPLRGRVETEVVVVGAGIVGLTTAMSLLEQGRSVVVLEARRVGRQVTGRSTAKITAQHALIYRHLIDTAGQATAQLYAEANRTAIARIRGWIGGLGISCDYQPKSAFAYAVAAEWRDAIASEAEAARAVGFEARLHARAPLPFETAAALEFPDQAQFNPAAYLAGLARAVSARGGHIHEHSRATGFAGDGAWHVTTAAGEVVAEHVVVATNITVKSPIGYAGRTQPRCHVAIGFRTSSAEPVEGMFIGVDEPTHSIRTARDRAGPLLVVLGPRFATGHDGDVAQRFRQLDTWAHAHLPVGEAVWRWCNEDYETADRRPFVGRPDREAAPGFHVATGFNAWGISNGSAAGLMIAAEIAGGSHGWEELFAAARPGGKDFNRGGVTQSARASVAEIGSGEGGVITRDGEQLAVFRDGAGSLHALSAHCTHKGCIVTWNNADQTWDCPCHGSVFEAGGEVIHGPARQPLPPRTL